MMTPFSLFHHIPDITFINRGRLTIWFDDHAIAAWRNTEPAAGPGAPRTYSDLAIECALVCKSVYHLSLRAAQGFLSSVVELMKLPLPIPNYSTVSRRQGALQIHLSPPLSHGPRHVVIDATGLKVYGVGEWRVWKHRVSRRRTWRKLHLGIDESTKEIVAVELTGSRMHDSQPLPALLEQIANPIDQVSGDGAYDTRACYEAVLERGATPVFVPRRTARLGAAKDPTGWRAARNRILQQIAAQGRSAWQVLSGYTRQSIAENTMGPAGRRRSSQRAKPIRRWPSASARACRRMPPSRARPRIFASPSPTARSRCGARLKPPRSGTG